MGFKITIAISNNKGGVGKTTLALMLAESLLVRTDKAINAIDIDPQHNFTDSLSLLDTERFKERLTVSNSIKLTGDINVIDCPPAISPTTTSAIKAADVIFVPIMPDMFSLVNIENIFKIGRENGKSPAQMPLVSIGFKSASKQILSEIKTFIETNNYFVTADIALNKLIPYNLLIGQMWDTGVTMAHKRVIYNLIQNIEKGVYK